MATPRVDEGVFEPRVVQPAPENEATVVRLPDDSLQIYYMLSGERVESIRSVDGGRTWSEPTVEFEMEGKRSHRACRTMVDADGEVHLFFVVHAGDPNEKPGKRLLNVWHNRTFDGRTRWRGAQQVYEGYVGALRGAVQMASGRLVVPFAAWIRDTPDSPTLPENTGFNYTTSIYSDDGGATFACSPSVITAPVPDHYNGNRDGACEPCVELLPDGRLWMLIRTQTGFLYQSFSDDGIHWSPGEPTHFHSSNSPAGVLRLDDDRLVVVWNNAQTPPRRDDHMLYGGRDTLHAAISEDGGQTWRGFREIYLDHRRHDDPPDRGDRGTAYPNLAQALEGHLVITTGQNPDHRVILLLHPDWLLETERQDDFSDGLNNWCACKEHGEFYRIFLPRICGPELIRDVDAPSGRAMRVRRPDERAPDCAVWNFPAGHRGRLSVRCKLPRCSAGARLTLQDHFHNPNDLTGEAEAMFVINIEPDGRVGEAHLMPDRWHTLTIDFDTSAGRAALQVEGQPAGALALAHPTHFGLSYLRIRATADEVDPAGVLIGEVRARTGAGHSS